MISEILSITIVASMTVLVGYPTCLYLIDTWEDYRRRFSN
jgi:hypothetical protein